MVAECVTGDAGAACRIAARDAAAAATAGDMNGEVGGTCGMRRCGLGVERRCAKGIAKPSLPMMGVLERGGVTEPAGGGLGGMS